LVDSKHLKSIIVQVFLFLLLQSVSSRTADPQALSQRTYTGCRRYWVSEAIRDKRFHIMAERKSTEPADRNRLMSAVNRNEETSGHRAVCAERARLSKCLGIMTFIKANLPVELERGGRKETLTKELPSAPARFARSWMALVDRSHAN
jgi:hypothetical protein